jgi:hypothetical protein
MPTTLPAERLLPDNDPELSVNYKRYHHKSKVIYYQISMVQVAFLGVSRFEAV